MRLHEALDIERLKPTVKYLPARLSRRPRPAILERDLMPQHPAMRQFVIVFLYAHTPIVAAGRGIVNRSL